MKRFRKKPPVTLSRSDALDCRPVRHPDVDERVLESGDVLLVYRVNVKPWATVLLQRLGRHAGRPPQKKLQLDALGTAVWNLLDGQRTVRQVARTFSRTHQLHQREAEAAVTQFVRELGRRGLVGLKSP